MELIPTNNSVSLRSEHRITVDNKSHFTVSKQLKSKNHSAGHSRPAIRCGSVKDDNIRPPLIIFKRKGLHKIYGALCIGSREYRIDGAMSFTRYTVELK